ncbi:MAG: tRNA pseudouridine(38-40) synthase TruA [Alphaproteobacteria bacterium]
MPRYKITMEYLGTGLVGWQRQKEGLSIQGFLSDAIFKLFNEEVVVQGAGRTDAGVHALGQVAHFDTKKWYHAETVNNALEFYLRESPISMLSTEEVTEAFHARFSATKRHYIYRILNRVAPPRIKQGRVWHMPYELDVPLMHETAQNFIGEHDFTSFRAKACQAKSPIKTLERLDVIKNGEEVEFHVSARSFLHHQVRNFVGTLKMVGTGRWQKEQVPEALKAKDRTMAGPTAPAEGLYFVKIEY